MRYCNVVFTLGSCLRVDDFYLLVFKACKLCLYTVLSATIHNFWIFLIQKDGVDCHVQFINCMNLSRSHRIYSKIAEELTGWDKLTNNEAQKFLAKKFTAKGTPM